MKKYEAYENILLAISGHLKDQEIISDSLKVIKHALTTPQISDSEVEDLLSNLELTIQSPFIMSDKTKKYHIEKLKTKFQQMQQKITHLTRSVSIFIDYTGHKTIPTQQERNDYVDKLEQYKQLLDKIEEHTLTLSSVCDNEFDNKHICEIQSILKQLKSLGGK